MKSRTLNGELNGVIQVALTANATLFFCEISKPDYYAVLSNYTRYYYCKEAPVQFSSKPPLLCRRFPCAPPPPPPSSSPSCPGSPAASWSPEFAWGGTSTSDNGGPGNVGEAQQVKQHVVRSQQVQARLRWKKVTTSAATATATTVVGST